MPRLRPIAALLLFCALQGCGGSGGPNAPDSAPASVPVVAPGNWSILGSSSAAGQGATTGRSWANLLQQAVSGRGVTIVNLAYGGLTTSEALPTGSVISPGQKPPDEAHNLSRALTSGPKLIVLSFPSNDTVAGYSAADTVANIRTLRAAASAASAATLVLGVQPRNALTPTQRTTLAEVERQLAVLAGDCHVALYAALADSDGNIAAAYSAGDGIHLNDAGHALVHARVQAVLEGGRCVRLGT